MNCISAQPVSAEALVCLKRVKNPELQFVGAASRARALQAAPASVPEEILSHPGHGPSSSWLLATPGS